MEVPASNKEYVYHLMSEAIPKHWTVIDFNPINLAQDIFSEHKKYVAVNMLQYDRQVSSPLPNCEIYCMSVEAYLREVFFPKEDVFVICNGCNMADIRLILAHFKNVFIYKLNF